MCRSKFGAGVRPNMCYRLGLPEELVDRQAGAQSPQDSGISHWVPLVVTAASGQQ